MTKKELFKKLENYNIAYRKARVLTARAERKLEIQRAREQMLFDALVGLVGKISEIINKEQKDSDKCHENQK